MLAMINLLERAASLSSSKTGLLPFPSNTKDTEIQF